jgi:hypothetical protein
MNGFGNPRMGFIRIGSRFDGRRLMKLVKVHQTHTKEIEEKRGFEHFARKEQKN